MRYRPEDVVFYVRRTGSQVDPAKWRARHEVAARRARSMFDRISGITRHNPDAALRIYLAQLYRMGVAQLKKSDPKRRP
jgi:hypothetical protein